MKSKIIWSKKSKTSLIEIKEYFTENTSPRIANRLVKEIINKAQLLLETPFAGQKDPFLEFKNQDFSKEDKNLKESIDSIGEVISNSFEEDFDEQQYNKKRRMRR